MRSSTPCGRDRAVGNTRPEGQGDGNREPACSWRGLCAKVVIRNRNGHDHFQGRVLRRQSRHEVDQSASRPGAHQGRAAKGLITEDGTVTDETTAKFLADYMTEFHAFITRVYKALPRTSVS